MIKALFTRIKVDWGEFVDHQLYINDMKRDRRRIRRAIKSAKVKNSIDGRTYYILRSPQGMPGAYNSTDVKYLRRAEVIPKDAKFNKLLEYSLAMITSNEVIRNSYTQIQNKKEQICPKG